MERLYATADAGEVSAGGSLTSKLQGKPTQLNFMALTAMAFALSSGVFTASVVAAPDSVKSNKPPSADCAKFSKQAAADVGDIIRAGCKPTLAQMSALMDNPVGNVAMWWNQVDYYGLENPKFNKSDHKTNYMGITQWPQAPSALFKWMQKPLFGD